MQNLTFLNSPLDNRSSQNNIAINTEFRRNRKLSIQLFIIFNLTCSSQQVKKTVQQIHIFTCDT